MCEVTFVCENRTLEMVQDLAGITEKLSGYLNAFDFVRFQVGVSLNDNGGSLVFAFNCEAPTGAVLEFSHDIPFDYEKSRTSRAWRVATVANQKIREFRRTVP